MEIDVEEVNVNFDWLETTLTQNGYYEIGEDEETGKFQPVLIPDWQEGDDYDIKVEVPEPTPTPPTFVSTEINQNGNYEMVEGQNGWQPEIVQNPDPLENYDLEINVPQTITNPLETLTNKRLQREGTFSISDLMEDSTNYSGITKDSNLIVDLPDYPPITSQKILNLTQNTVNSQTIYPDPGEFWNSIQYSVNVDKRIQLSINDFKFQVENKSSLSFTKQNVNWNYNLTSSSGNFSALAVIYEFGDKYQVGFRRVDDGASQNFLGPSEAIGNYMYEAVVSGSYQNGDSKIICRNQDLLTGFNMRNSSADRVNIYCYLPKSDYLITDFGN